MKRTFSTRIIAGIATSAVLAVGTLSFTAINAIADEAVNYYGLSADGTVISGTVTDYTKMTSSDTAWGIAGKETWYVADGIFSIYTTNPLNLKGNVNVILKNGAEVKVWNGIAGTDATITFYSESESASGVIGFIGATGSEGSRGKTCSGSDAVDGENGADGKAAVNVSSFTVAGGTVTVIGGKGGKGGDAGYDDMTSSVLYEGTGGNGGNGGAAITDNTKVHLNGGRLNVTAGRGGDAGVNTHAPDEERDNYKGKLGNHGTSLSGIYAVNGILNVNKLDDSDADDTSGDFELLSVNGYENAKLDIIGKGTAKVADGTVIETYGDISVAGTLSVDNGMIFTNGSITKADSASQITKTNGGVIRRLTPAYGIGYTLDYAGGKCIAETGYKIKLSHGNTLTDVAAPDTIVSESNRLNIVRSGDGEIIDDSEPCTNVMPYCIKANNTNETTVTDGNVFAMRGVSSRFVFALNNPDEYRFSGVTVTDADGNVIPDDKYTFDSTTGEFIALSVDRNLIVTANASLKDVEISVTDSENNPVSIVDFGTDIDGESTATPLMFKLKVTEGGFITKYRVVKESDLNKASGVVTDTSSFTVSYTAGNEWGTADDGSLKMAKGATSTFTVKPDSNLAAGTYTEDFIVITDRTAYADASAGTQDKALARFTLTYTVEHKIDPPHSHVWESDYTIDKEPTCTQAGSESIHCSLCDARKDIKEISPKGHDWSEWKTLVEPTITSEGKASRSCNVCSIKEEKALSKLSGKKEWKHDEKKHWHVDDNGDIIDADDHEFKWVVDKEPTATEPGIGHYECIACAFEKAPEEFGKRNPETGASSLAAWIAVAVVAGGAVPVTYKARKRKNK